MKLHMLAIPAVLAWMVSMPAAAKPNASDPDVVVLKDGSLVRGTISELKKGEFVTIFLMTGETRTIPTAKVEYAGADSTVPRTLPEGAKGSGGSAQLLLPRCSLIWLDRVSVPYEVVSCAPWIIERTSLELPAIVSRIRAVREGRKLHQVTPEQQELPLK